MRTVLPRHRCLSGTNEPVRPLARLTTALAMLAKHPAVWLTCALLVVAVNAPRYWRVWRPTHLPIDLFQEWASARNYFNDLPIYLAHDVSVPMYLGHERSATGGE